MLTCGRGTPRWGTDPSLRLVVRTDPRGAPRLPKGDEGGLPPELLEGVLASALIGSRFRPAAEMQLPVVMDLVRAQQRCHPDRP
jgi:hypothetical protein